MHHDEIDVTYMSQVGSGPVVVVYQGSFRKAFVLSVSLYSCLVEVLIPEQKPSNIDGIPCVGDVANILCPCSISRCYSVSIQEFSGGAYH